MSAFDFILSLLSFVYALALGQVLTSTGRLLVERRRVRFSGLLALAMLNAVIQVYICWLSLWDYRDTQGFDLYTVTLFFLSAILIYIFCVTVSPDPAPEGEIDLEAFFWANHRLFYGAYAVLVVLFIASTAVFLRTSQPHLFLQEALSNIPFLILSLIAIFTRRRWAQWAAGITLAIMSVAWSIAFSSSF